MSLIPAPERQRQVDLCEFEASLVYKASSRTGRTVTQRSPITREKKKEERKKRKEISNNEHHAGPWFALDNLSVTQPQRAASLLV